MIRFGNIARWYIAAIWLSVWSLCSCTEDIDPEFSAESAPQYGIVLTTGTMNTRAGTVAGENTENTISNYAIFLYSSEGDNQQPVYALSGTCNAANSTTVTAKVPLDKIPELFGNGTTCYAYALVNYPATVDINTTALTIKGEGMETAAAATIANIKALQVSSDDFSRNAAPSAFVMHGASTESGITLSDDGKNMTGTIPLKRVASKIKLWVNILDKIYVDKDNRTVERTEGVSEAEFEAELLRNGGAVCIPRLDNVNTFINNGVKTARIDGTTMEMVTTDDGNTAEQCWLQDADYFSVARSRTTFRPITEATNPEEGWNYQRTHDIPMYSYPNTWTSSIEENRQTYLLLMVNWNIRRQGDGDNANYKPCYYFIPVNARSATPNRLESNKYYRIGVNVGMLGSFNPGEPQIIESATWEVLDWTKEPIDATLKGSRYLVLNQTEFVMNNEDSIQIPFTASHEVEIKNVYVTYFR
ncbi:MAG: hypothetical protein J1F25_07870, partial [Prevotellaceae bacterium]|nr:hypothetical protein [Prevotellaceae bacterium]